MEDIINRLDEQSLTKQLLRLTFERIVVFSPGELTQTDSLYPELDEESKRLIFERGGVVFLEKCEEPVGLMTP